MSESEGIPNPGSARFVLDLRDGITIVASEQHIGLIEYSLDANGCVIDAKPCTVDNLTADERDLYEEMITETITTEQHTIFDAVWGDEVAPNYGSEHGGGLLGPIKLDGISPRAPALGDHRFSERDMLDSPYDCRRHTYEISRFL